MSALLTVILPAIVPALTDGFRGLMAKVTGGAGGQPQNVQEQIALMAAQTERVKALAALDAIAPNASTWVANLRGSFRYISVGAIVLAGIVGAFTPGMDAAALAVLLDLAGASMSFIVGERMYLGLKSKP